MHLDTRFGVGACVIVDLTSHLPRPWRRLLALAERAPRRAVPLIRRALTTDLPADLTPWAHYTMGTALLLWERFTEARLALLTAQAAFAQQQFGMGRLSCQRLLLLADAIQCAHPDLEPAIATLAEALTEAGALVEAGRARIDQARLLNGLGRPQDAAAALASARPFLTNGAPVDHARWLWVQGLIAIHLSDYDHAADLLAQAEQAFASIDHRPALARCWADQGWLALRQERLDLALACYQRAERACARLDLPLRLAYCAKNIGWVQTMRGAYDQALPALITARERFRAINQRADVAGCDLNLGNIHFYTGRWEAALACYVQAEQHYGADGFVESLLVTRRNQAMVYRALHRHAEAHALLAGVVAQAAELGYQAEVAEARSVQAALLADAGLDAAAEERYVVAQALFTQLGNRPAGAECQLERGRLAMRAGRLEAARAHFAAAEPDLVRHPHHQWRVHYGLGRCAEQLGDTSLALAHYQRASVIVAGLRRRLISEQISSSLYQQAAQLHQAAITLAAREGALELLLELSEAQRALTLDRLLAARPSPLALADQLELDQARLHLESALATGTTPGIDAALRDYHEVLLHCRHHRLPDNIGAAAPQFQLAALRQRLAALYDDDWTLIAYVDNDDQLMAIIVSPEQLALAQTPLDRRLRRLLTQASDPAYRHYTYRDLPYHQGQTTRPWDGLRRLSEHLLPEAARRRLHPAHRLILAPAGPLHGLPWSVLRLDQGWLVERAIIQVIPSLRTLLALSTARTAPTHPALLVGCSTFGERAPALPRVADELQTIATHWPGVCQQLRDADVTREQLLGRAARGELARYGLVHIASHAQLLPARGLAAHVKLADGDLRLPEIAEMHLDGPLVTLSACDGSATDVLPGEEVLSLSWAFLAAGASSVLASRWPVDDLATHGVMELFYRALARHGDAAHALAETQRALPGLAEAEMAPAAAPDCWGSFVLTGGCGPRVTTGGAAPSPRSDHRTG